MPTWPRRVREKGRGAGGRGGPRLHAERADDGGVAPQPLQQLLQRRAPEHHRHERAEHHARAVQPADGRERVQDHLHAPGAPGSGSCSTRRLPGRGTRRRGPHSLGHAPRPRRRRSPQQGQAAQGAAGRRALPQPSRPARAAAQRTRWNAVDTRWLRRMMPRAAGGGRSPNSMCAASTEASTKKRSQLSRMTASATSTRGISSRCSGAAMRAISPPCLRSILRGRAARPRLRARQEAQQARAQRPGRPGSCAGASSAGRRDWAPAR